MHGRNFFSVLSQRLYKANVVRKEVAQGYFIKVNNQPDVSLCGRLVIAKKKLFYKATINYKTNVCKSCLLLLFYFSWEVNQPKKKTIIGFKQKNKYTH